MSAVKYWITLIAVATLCGCSGSEFPDTTPVSGVVTYNGDPVEGATVVLAPRATDGTSASGLTNENGVYQVAAFADTTGAVAGEYRVTVSKTTMIGGLSADEAQKLLDAGKEVPQAKHKDELPAKYKNAATSGLVVSVPDSGNVVLEIELKD